MFVNSNSYNSFALGHILKGAGWKEQMEVLKKGFERKKKRIENKLDHTAKGNLH